MLSASLGSALKCDSKDPAYVTLLFTAFILSFSALFLTEGNTTHLMFLYLVTPLIFIPFKFKMVKIWSIPLIIPEKFCLYNLFRNVTLCRTPLFFAVFIYGVNKSFLSYLYPEPNLGYLHIFFYYLLAPLLVLMITIVRLCVDRPNFYFQFFRLIGVVAALNAAINIYLFIKNLPNFTALSSTHMSSSFGAAIGYNPNLDCLVYALYFIGLIVTLIQNFCLKDLCLTVPSTVILIIAILLEQSRATLLGVFISLSLFAALSTKSKKKAVIMSLFTLLLLTIVYSSLFLPKGLSTYFIRGESYRSEVWRRYFDVVMESPILGIGDRTVRAIFLSDGEKQLHAHSILLSSWLRGGLLGLLTMMYIAISGVRLSFKYAKSYTIFVPYCVFIVVVVDGIFNSELKVWQAGWEWAGYWLAIALVVGAEAKIRNSKSLLIEKRTEPLPSLVIVDDR